MELGIYESLITASLRNKLDQFDKTKYYILEDKKLDAAEAIHFLGGHLSGALSSALGLVKADKGEELVDKQIQVTNALLRQITTLISQYDFKEDLIDAEGHILEGIVDFWNSDYSTSEQAKLHLKEIMPLTRLTQSELFTGGNVELSLESELKKEILSSDRVDLLVSFIKWKAIVILRDALQSFTNRGGLLRVLTTTYMGASDARAIDELSKLANAQVKVSYNNGNERLHAKAYLFYRNTGFHTGYIGSSNFSRSALTDGLEWNVKVTTKEIPQIIDKFQKTFESYWNSAEFELYDASRLEALDTALKKNKLGKSDDEGVVQFFDIQPYHYQKEILEKLQVERKVHGSFRNLVVAATGTGKTMVSAFDFKQFRKSNPQARFLFVAHRMEILRQAMRTFRMILREQNFGELLGDGYQPTHKSAVFATVQSLNNLDFASFCAPAFYDYIVLDEVHHAQANTYQKIIQYFQPKILLGLTATPERMDGKSILPDFNDRMAAEIRLPDALNNKLLCPFQYFGISDSVDYSQIGWRNGRYNTEELNNVFTGNELRVGEIINNLRKYTRDYEDVTALGFCATIQHAQFMARKFQKAGLKAEYLVSDNSDRRVELLTQLQKKEFNYLFVVDIFNEGVDIPQVDTVLFLRPTESLTIFLQQLGRGLRLYEGKEVLTVLDFVGQSRVEYDFENKFRALVGKTNTSITKELEQDFPHLPLGCSIVLEKQAKAYILDNIRKATSSNKRDLIARLLKFSQSGMPLTLLQFLKYYNLRLAQIYKNRTFSELKAEAFGQTINTNLLERYRSMLCNKWIVTESLSYFRYIQQLMAVHFDITLLPQTEENELMALMLYYDFYGDATKDATLKSKIQQIGTNKAMVQEMKEFIEVKIEQLDFEEMPCVDLPYSLPLRIHARYTRDQILVALRMSTLDKKSPSREGVAENKALQTEAFFVNLKKSEEDFSPTTMYEDYAISDTLFHWQSQNQTSISSEKGRSYILHKQKGKTLLLFLRESKNDMDGNTQGFVFIGPINYVDSYGSKPMSITWQLEEPIPNYLWKESAKMRVG